MILLAVFGALVLLGLGAARWGADSRDGHDWRATPPYPSQSPPRTSADASRLAAVRTGR